MPTTTSRLPDEELWRRLSDKDGVSAHSKTIDGDPRIEDWYMRGWIALYGNRWRTVLAKRPWTSTPKEQP